jgi:hypothetical protein
MSRPQWVRIDHRIIPTWLDALQKLTFSESNNTNSSGLGSRSEESANSSTKGWLSRKLGNMGSNDVHVGTAPATSNSEDSGAGGSS